MLLPSSHHLATDDGELKEEERTRNVLPLFFPSHRRPLLITSVNWEIFSGHKG